jgi:DNA polymerase/3'-5' exonuclease PolX
VTSENGEKASHPLGSVLVAYHRLAAHIETLWHAKISPGWNIDPEISLHLAGSARRGLPTCGDLDAVLHIPAGRSWGFTVDMLEAAAWPAEIARVEEMRVANGVVLRFADGLSVDVRVVQHPDLIGGALAFMTGPRRFNRLMADRLFGSSERAPEIAQIAGTERAVLFSALGCWVPPSERESYAAQNGF